MELTPSVVFALLASTDEFPVDFNDAVVWWDCKAKTGKPVRRDNLVRKLTTNFHRGIDYHLLKNEEVVDRPQGGGTTLDKYFLTVECFKMMGMMLPGKRGREIRQYFLTCEAEMNYPAASGRGIRIKKERVARLCVT